MSTWLSAFLLGRPGYEYSFELNPEAMTIEETSVGVVQRNLAGDLKKSLLKVSAPTVKLNSQYLTMTQRQQFQQLTAVKDSFLSFKTRSDWQVVLEKDVPSTTTTVVIENTSVTRLDVILTNAGFASIISINGIFQNPDGTGTNYYAAGSTYANATRTATVTQNFLDSVSPVYVTYTYSGWLVNMQSIPTRAVGGKVDIFEYDYQLVGA